MRLLVVEDDAAFRNFLRVQIAEEAPKGVPHIIEAATLTDALEIVHEEQIDAVLSDGSFPPAWGEGMGPCREWWKSSVELRKHCLTHSVPLVLLSGDLALVESARVQGSPAFNKPYEFRSAIQKVLALASAHPVTNPK
ncbi:MAG: hypothetical protein KGM47_03195 [Acidobacteriota bacterium]|nr:hypothetical protein [Acidobacteriota bacterium]